MAEDKLRLTTPSCRASLNPSASAPLQPCIVLFKRRRLLQVPVTCALKQALLSLLGCLPQTAWWPLKGWLIWQVALRWAGGRSRAAFFIFTHFCSRCLPHFSQHRPAVQLMLHPYQRGCSFNLSVLPKLGMRPHSANVIMSENINEKQHSRRRVRLLLLSEYWINDENEDCDSA